MKAAGSLRVIAPVVFLFACTVDVSDIPVAVRDFAKIPDGGQGDAGRELEMCGGARDGAPCGTARICLAQVCVDSVCGDGVVDRRLDEECDGDAMESDDDGGLATCVLCKLCMDDDCLGNQSCPDGTVGRQEICNNLDDDCDKKIDEGIEDKALYVDVDGDGFGDDRQRIEGCELKEGLATRGGDCDDASNTTFPGAGEMCNGVDDDCNDTVDDGCPCVPGNELSCGATRDGMLLTTEPCRPGRQACTGGEYGDCEGAVGPKEETCDGTDEDCDGVVDNGVRVKCWPDEDGDGYAAAGATLNARCECLANETQREPVGDEIDCDDNEETVSPGDAELCNARDDDCDGQQDEGALVTYYEDQDGDGFGKDSTGVGRCDKPTTGVWVTKGGDCNDANDQIKPGQMESCNNTDSDCDGITDNVAGGTCACQAGASRPCGPTDGNGNFLTDGICKSGMEACMDGAWSQVCTGAQGPMTEVCDSARVDEDCDGLKNEGPDQVDGSLETRCYLDMDRDGFAAAAAASNPMGVCSGCPPGWTATAPTGTAVDCADNDETVYPGRAEVCNGKDDNCVGGPDEGFGIGTACGIGACAGGVLECASAQNTRCSTQPGGSADKSVSEVCDGANNDCDGATDEQIPNTGAGVSCGSNTGVCKAGTRRCTNGNIVCEGEVKGSADDKTCDDRDDDCNGMTDDGVPNISNKGKPCTAGSGACQASGTWVCNGSGTGLTCSATPMNADTTCYRDVDGDTYAPAMASTMMTCGGCPAGWTNRAPVSTATRDCDDNDNEENPAGTERCDGKDNDCANGVDDPFPTLGNNCTVGSGSCQGSGVYVCNAQGTGVTCNGTVMNPTTTCYTDSDRDGYAPSGASTMGVCSTCPVGWTSQAPGGQATTDCNDNDAASSPADSEVCDGGDNDCDGMSDEGNPGETCLDNDRHRYCSGGSQRTESCNTQHGNTCFQNRCSGTCIADSRVCVSGQNAFQICGINGQPGTATNCTNLGSSYFEVCRSGQCTESLEVPIGFDDVASTGGSWNANGALNASQWRVMRINVPRDVRLYSLNVILSNVPGGMQVRMALWDEDASGAFGAQPGSVLHQALGQPANNGVNSLPISSRPILTGGRNYWLGVNVNQNANIRFGSISSSRYVFTNMSFLTDPAGAAFPLVSSSTGAYSMFLMIKELL